MSVCVQITKHIHCNIGYICCMILAVTCMDQRAVLVLVGTIKHQRYEIFRRGGSMPENAWKFEPFPRKYSK